MAKEFKDWNKAFSKEEIAACRNEYYYSVDTIIREDITEFNSWDYGYWQPSHEEVRQAVYKADDAHEWQLFRVSLKGLTTYEKIAMLTEYYHRYYLTEQSVQARNMAKVRVHNYIGALRRGGQLNTKLQVVK